MRDDRSATACHVSGADCLYPASGNLTANLRCYRCGLSVCKHCSRMTWYLTIRKRLCEECLEGLSRVDWRAADALKDLRALREARGD